MISITGIRESRVLLLRPLQFDTAQALLIHDGRCVHKLYTSFSGLPNHYRPHCIHLIKAGVSGHRNTQLTATN